MTNMTCLGSAGNGASKRPPRCDETGPIEVFELGADGRYVRALGADRGRLNIPRCDGLELDLDQLWAEVDRLEDV